MSTASGTCQTVTATCHYRGRVGTGLSVHTQTSSNSSTIAAGSSNGLISTRAVHTVVCAPDDGRRYHPKRVEHFTDINKLCYVAS